MARHVRQGDQVEVTAGSDKGRQGKVLRVIPDRDNPNRDRVVVEGVNLHIRHVRPTQENQRGGRVRREMPIHISNVSPVMDAKPTRVRFQTRDDGSKIRVAASTGAQIGEPLKKAR